MSARTHECPECGKNWHCDGCDVSDTLKHCEFCINASKSKPAAESYWSKAVLPDVRKQAVFDMPPMQSKPVESAERDALNYGVGFTRVAPADVYKTEPAEPGRDYGLLTKEEWEECSAYNESETAIEHSRLVKAETDIETLRMQLAGCGVAALMNTRESAKNRIDRANPYWSASYEGVCRAVDREIDLRENLAVAVEALRTHRSKQTLRGLYECDCELCMALARIEGVHE